MTVPVRAHLTYRGSLDEKVKGLGAVVKQALTDALLVWHGKMLPLHFGTQSSVQARYGSQVQARTRKYMIRKNKKYGQQNMLSYSGELERNVTRGIIVSGSAKQVRGRLPGSQKANFRRSASSPNMRAELVAINEAEATELALIVDAVVSKFLNDRKKTKTVVKEI